MERGSEMGPVRYLPEDKKGPHPVYSRGNVVRFSGMAAGLPGRVSASSGPTAK